MARSGIIRPFAPSQITILTALFLRSPAAEAVPPHEGSKLAAPLTFRNASIKLSYIRQVERHFFPRALNLTTLADALKKQIQERAVS